ncbi:MAG: hypothetical protein C3F13_17655 [Anaerolineales bacterium]|nr:hypothetical protein [Anaerolineae bacterium]PWB50288.1 MAG: hypothetical protein C3F13_17655 [Anaerolineales bacterium]
MSLIHPISLNATIDACSEEFFYGKPIPVPLRKDLAAMLINRQILSGSNSGFFIPFAAEPKDQIRMFTGETLHTELASRHLPLIEATRLLVLLAVENEASHKSTQLANQRMSRMCYSRFCSSGECRALTVAYMRYMIVQDTPEANERLSQFLEHLKAQRDGKGRWRGFPYHYTLLMLSELSEPLARSELKYAHPILEKLAGQAKPEEPCVDRRQAIIRTILSRS